MSKEEVIERFGLRDGQDEDRYEKAIQCAGMIDRPVWVAFRSLVNLENKGLVKLTKVQE